MLGRSYTTYTIAPQAPTDPQTILRQGEALSAAGRLDQAVAIFEQGLRAFPAADGFRISLGYLRLRLNDPGAARAMFEHVRTAAPGRQDAMVGLAQVLDLEGDHAAAADLYRRALAIRPDNAGARIALGKCLLELGERDAGEAELRRVAEHAPELAGPVLSALAASPRGRFFLRPSAGRDFLKA
jgi:tetratricopeptide (TPR) repeat protein